MAAYTIYHNPRCSKSRETLKLLEEKGIQPHIVEYLKTPPSAATVLALSKGLGLPVADFLRHKEDEYKALHLKGFTGTDEALAEIVSEHPKLLERPIVVRESDQHARIGRPPEAVLELL
ncbi:arsenate reductase (glutaredoxin) [Aliidiomarina iranensis]|uniref:Arsenate reductase n=1 Tax=Aliidiomarina iranensis TaxID=1434071 RepID=A0A432VZM3_9GAMM|nr:arsenate reductase (glutaredoxin) [Aliidiomarina iranensis]RUO22214.1 arsenate reductase (glutaredoxin) [Aliidiomarina iranensis]